MKLAGPLIMFAVGSAAAVALALAETSTIWNAVPIQIGDRCERCGRAIVDRYVAAEAIGPHDGVAYKFRTVRCLLKYLEKVPVLYFDEILVADYQTGRLFPVSKASFVRMNLDWRTGERHYGTGDADYVAFQSSASAERLAASLGTAPLDWKEVQAFERFAAFATD
jgi:hypothetical protein